MSTAPAATNASSPISHPGRQHDTAADPARAAQRRTGQRELGTVARHRVVVGGARARADEDVVLDDRAGGQIDVRLHAHAAPTSNVVVDDAAPADHRARPDPRALTHEALVAEDRALADAGC